MDSNPIQKYSAEFIGTMALVLIGCGTAVFGPPRMFGPSAIPDFVAIALAFGMTVTAMAYAIGPISGCHINPAISIAMVAAGKLEAKHLAGYIGAQIAGGIAGAGILVLIASGLDGFDAAHSMGQNGYAEFSPGGYNLVSGLVAEIVFTFLFLMVIFGSTASNATPAMAGLAIGMALVIIHLVSVPITGTSVNPARSIGPALFAGTDHIMQLWMFIVGPIVGGLLAAFTWKGIFGNK